METLSSEKPPTDKPKVPAVAALPNREEPATPVLTSAPATWPPEAIEFGRTFYPRGSTPDRRREDVATQITGVLNGGCAFKGEVIRATPERLARRCREVLDNPPNDPTKAIVVLLTKLSDVGNAQDSPTEAAARQAREEFADDSRERLIWMQEHPSEATAIRKKIDRLFPVIGKSERDALVASEVRRAMSATEAPQTTAGGP